MVITKICPICNKKFETDQNAKKYCSEECNKISKRKPERTFVCECCEKEFKSVRKRKFCSPACRDYSAGRAPINKGKKKKTASLSEVLARAKAEGITYGECVAKYGYE